MFVSFITSRDWADQDLSLVISPHVSPQVLFSREDPTALLAPKLFLSSAFSVHSFSAPSQLCLLLLHFILNYFGERGEVHDRPVPVVGAHQTDTQPGLAWSRGVN